MNYLMEKWKEIIFIAFVVGVVWTFNSIRVSAIDAKEKADSVSVKFEKQQVEYQQAIKDLSSISKSLMSPNQWLNGYLINHGIDSVDAKKWSLMPRCNEILDSNGVPERTIPCLDESLLPEMGVVNINTGRVCPLDTLWNFNAIH